MPFPDSERVVYRQNPLAEVICQLRFPPILRIGVSEPADFQELVRQEYPYYELQQPKLGPPGLNVIIEQLSLPLPSGLSTHKFASRDSTTFLSLSQEFLALSTQRYHGWESFRVALEQAEVALRQVYRPALYTRVGLRYRDLISRRRLHLDGRQWSQLLQPHILAELSDPAVEDQILQSETRSVVRIPEIPDATVTITHGLEQAPDAEEQCYSIDADFAVQRTEGINDIFSILDRFNRLAGNLFRWAIRDELHYAMEPSQA